MTSSWHTDGQNTEDGFCSKLVHRHFTIGILRLWFSSQEIHIHLRSEYLDFQKTQLTNVILVLTKARELYTLNTVLNWYLLTNTLDTTMLYTTLHTMLSNLNAEFYKWQSHKCKWFFFSGEWIHMPNYIFHTWTGMSIAITFYYTVWSTVKHV